MLYAKLLALFLPFTAAHMRLSDPRPLNLDLDPNYTSPLERFYEKAPFPCRGHLSSFSSSPIEAAWEIGSNQTFTLTGTHPHYGGSSQISLSSDQGKTWKVIKSFPGSCPHRRPEDPQTFDFRVPAQASPGTVVFSWSWFNREQEMSHNCAKVKLVGQGGEGLSAFPDMLIADVDESTCRTPLTVAETLFEGVGLHGDEVEMGDGEYPLQPANCA